MRALTIFEPFIPQPIYQALREMKARLEGRRSIPTLIRRHCRGSGIEIGAGSHPYCSPSNTIFVDRSSENAHGTRNADILADAAHIPLADASFDFLFSSHCLEHHQNTIATLREWLRLLKPGGTLFLILPHAERGLDRHRARTTLEHHIQDFETLGEEPDRSHFEEMKAGWRALEDLAHWEAYHREFWKADFWDWEFRLANDNFHFHVWTQDDMVKLLHHLGLEILYVDDHLPDRGDSFVVIARKQLPAGGQVRDQASRSGQTATPQ